MEAIKPQQNSEFEVNNLIKKYTNLKVRISYDSQHSKYFVDLYTLDEKWSLLKIVPNFFEYTKQNTYDHLRNILEECWFNESITTLPKSVLSIREFLQFNQKESDFEVKSPRAMTKEALTSLINHFIKAEIDWGDLNFLEALKTYTTDPFSLDPSELVVREGEIVKLIDLRIFEWSFSQNSLQIMFYIWHELEKMIISNIILDKWVNPGVYFSSLTWNIWINWITPVSTDFSSTPDARKENIKVFRLNSDVGSVSVIKDYLTSIWEYPDSWATWEFKYIWKVNTEEWDKYRFEITKRELPTD